jgi:hypothetical protein
MGRPPLDIGQHGSVSFTREDSGWVARCRFRDLDGVTRRVERRGVTRTAADAALREQLRRRGGRHAQRPRPNSRFRDAASVWMAKIADRRSDSTVETYSYRPDALVLPRLGEQRLSEFDTEHMTGLQRARARRTRPRSRRRHDKREAAVLGPHPAHDPLDRQRDPQASRPGGAIPANQTRR